MRAIVLAISLAATSALAEDIVPADPWEVIHTAREFGEAEVGKDALQDPVILGTYQADEDMPKIGYQIGFYDCDLGRACRILLFRAQLNDKAWKKMPPNPAIFDLWNRRKLVGRAYWDPQSGAVLEHAVAMSDGLPKKTLESVFQMWTGAVIDYSEFLDETGT